MQIYEIKEKILNSQMKLNPYAKAYFEALDEAYSFYGVAGVKAQVIYIMVNVKAKGEVQKKLKAELIAYGNS